MQKVGAWLVIGMVLCIPLLYLGHLYANYEKIQADLQRKSAIAVQPTVGAGDASEIGYIYSMRRETYIREGRLNLVWFVVVPATNIHYSCSYEAGFPDFKTGDSVGIIHTNSDEEGHYGYIIGLHDNKQGKVASVWNFNLDTAELDLPDQ
jgi:hypothetical protein